MPIAPGHLDIDTIEASANCWYCLREGGIPWDRPASMTSYNRCHDAYDGKHYVKIPHCDFGGMHDWLFKLEERNRLKIRHLSGSQFAKVFGEQHLVHDPLKPSPVDCEFLIRLLNGIKALEDLSIFLHIDRIDKDLKEKLVHAISRHGRSLRCSNSENERRLQVASSCTYLRIQRR